MSQNRHALADWGFRLIIVALAILWLVFPPLGAERADAPQTALGRLITAQPASEPLP